MLKLANILLVDDNEDDYEATARSFQRNRSLNIIYWCKNGHEALDYLARYNGPDADYNKAVDIILLDLNMPGMDGRRTLEMIKANPLYNRIPVVVLTTSADSRDVNRCYALGASTYIQKPVSFEGLTDVVKTMAQYWFGVAILPQQHPLADL
jgi:two-component system, response regulator